MRGIAEVLFCCGFRRIVCEGGDVSVGMLFVHVSRNIEVCRTKNYIFPRAHAASYVTNILKMAWYKLYHPQAFHAAWLTLHTEELEATDFELDTMQLRRAILAIRSEKMENEKEYRYSYEDYERKNALEILLEMKARKIQILYSERFAKGQGYFAKDGEHVSYHIE